MLNFLKDESGQGMSEYALILALIAIGVIAALTLLKGSIQSKFNQIGDTLNNAGTS